MDSKAKREMILNGNMNKVILMLSLPIMANNFIQTIYNLTDTYFVSKLGTTQLAAMQFVWPMVFLLISLGIGFTMAGTTLISQYIGSGDKASAAKLGAQVISFSILFSTLVGVVGYIFTPQILDLIGATGDLRAYGDSFIRIMFLGTPTMFLMASYSSIKTGMGDTYSPMIIGAMSVATNIILDPIFIFKMDMGIQGAAIATVIARGVFGLYAVSTLFIKNGELYLKVSDLIPDKKHIKMLLDIGLPNSIGQTTTSIGFMVLNIFVLSYGEATITALSIGNRINGLILMPAMGIGNALAAIVGQNLGADNLDRAKKAVRSAAILSTLVLTIGGIPIIVFAEQVVSIFTVDPSVLSQGTYYLILVTLAIPLMGIYQVFIGTFQGSGHTLFSMILMFGRLWLVRIPMIIVLKTFFDMGANAVWYSMIFSNVIVCIVGYIMYQSGRWEKKVIRKAVEMESV